ncbi:MAG: Unknown protein [uncultured Sulfurovum sp.]|uniref:Uncharacterized protein n=1 Tax=uncultured Sulfurovum sp. TaxID=269237 RepID=A0A6S6S668_9BACT|nr:MAG: Unknown protein [uncultured Sulfurovum sp.]
MEDFLYLVQNNMSYNLSSIGIILFFSLLRTFLRQKKAETGDSFLRDFGKTFGFLMFLYLLFIIFKWYPF